MHAIHVGPGRLGLGLVAVHLKELMGLEVYLVGRPQAADARPEQYSFLYSPIGSGEPQRQVELFDAGNPADISALPEVIAGWITGQSPLLVTCSLEKHAPSRHLFLAEILAARLPDSETLVIVCENVPDPCYAQLRETFPHVSVRNAVVDRICIVPGDRKWSMDGRRQVEAHEVWEWVVELSDDEVPTIAQALVSSGVILTDDKTPYKERKTWTVNGLHQLLALMAHDFGADSLPAIASTDRFHAAAQLILDALTETLQRRWPDVPIPDDYMADRIRAFSEMRDSATRILEKYLVRADLTRLLERLNDRVFDAARAASDSDVDPTPFEVVVEILLRVVADPEKFFPSDLPPVPDTAVLEAFRACLKGWCDPDRAQDRVAELERALRVTQ